MIEKQEILQKLNAVLESKINYKEAYEWALKIIITPEYDELCKKNKLLADAIHALFCLHDEDPQFNTSMEELIYYRDRLLSEKTQRQCTEQP